MQPSDLHARREAAARRWRAEVRRTLAGRDPGLIDEVAAHLSDRWAALVQSGASDGDADQVVRAELDRWRQVPADARASRRAALLSGLAHDVRDAWRGLVRRRLLAGASMLLIALAIAAAVTTLAVVYGILWRPLPYPEANRLAVLWQVTRGQPQQVSFPDYLDLAGVPVFDGATAVAGGRGSLRVGTAIERVNALELEPTGYALLGARPLLGRLLGETDAGTPNVMISHRAWRGYFGGDSAIVGRQLWLSGRHLIVVGVLAPGFDFELPVGDTFRLEKHDVWMAMAPTPQFAARRDVSTYQALVRLAPGVTLEEAQRALDTQAAALAARHAATNRDRSFRIVPLHEQVAAPVRQPLAIAALATLLTLGIALVNLISLRAADVGGRSRELGIRQALGAGRLRIRRALLVEHLLLGTAAGAAGFAGAVPAIAAAAASDALQLPRADAIRLDAPVLVPGVLIVLLIAATLTALPLARPSADMLRAGGRLPGVRSRSVRRMLIGAEIALAVVLAAGGALLGLSLMRLLETDPGFDPTGGASARVSAYQARYPTLADVERFIAAVLREIDALPGVTHAAAGSSLPLSGQSTGTGVLAEGQAGGAAERTPAGWQFVTPGYFDALGMRLLRGRDFTDADRAHAGHVTIVNDALARALFGDADPIGRRIAVGDGNASGDLHEIVGVVADVRHHALDTAPAPRVYDLFGEHWGRTLYVVARTSLGDSASVLPAIRTTVGGLDLEVPVFEAATMDALLHRSAAPYRFAAMISAVLAVCALLFAATGVYGVASAIFLERSTELGIRAALGAPRSRLLSLVLVEGVSIAATGVAVGAAGAIFGSKLLATQLFGVRGADVVVVIAAAGTLLLFTALLSALPAARRAAAADPLNVLRAD